MKLLASRTSPYARKVRIVLAERNVAYTYVEALPSDPNNVIGEHNPLGKIPVLVLDDGTSLFDSRVIVEYVDGLASSTAPRLIPEGPDERIAVKRWEALADGICDATSLMTMERRRPAEQQSAAWIARQQAKVDRGLAELSRGLGERTWCSAQRFTLADIATGCALGYVDLRQGAGDWRTQYPNLARLDAVLAQRPAFRATVSTG